MQFHILVDLPDAEAIWRRYEDQADLYVYQTYDWVTHWHETIGRHRGTTPCLVDVRDGDGEPLAFLPFGLEKRLLGSALVWLGGDIADYHGPLLTPKGSASLDHRAIDSLLRVIRERYPTLSHAEFHRQPAFIGDLPNPFSSLGRFARSEVALSSKLIGDWPAFYADKRSKKTRHNDRRKRRKLETMGTLDFVIATTPEEIDVQVRAMLAQKERYVARLGMTNNLLQRGHDEFLKRLAGDRTMVGQTLLCALKLDDRILAVQWGVLYRGRFFSVVASYDDGQLSRYSTGETLLRELLAWCFDNDVDIVDFTCGDEPYKLAWCDRTLNLEDRLLALGAMGQVVVGGKLLLTMLKRRAKSIRALREAIAAVRGRMRHSLSGRRPPSDVATGQQAGSTNG